MKQYDYKTISRTMLGDLHTPVSTYLKVRDIFPQSALMESSDYHGSENNRSFIALCPLASVSIDHGTAIFRLPDDSREEHPITDAYRVENALNDFRARFRVEGEYSNYCGLYGYTSFNAVRYFENIPVKDSREATNDAPDMLYILYKYLIVFNDFKNEMLLLEMLAPGETSELDQVQKAIHNRNYTAYDFRAVGPTTSPLTDEEHKANIRRGIAHCLRGDVFQIVLSADSSSVSQAMTSSSTVPCAASTLLPICSISTSGASAFSARLPKPIAVSKAAMPTSTPLPEPRSAPAMQSRTPSMPGTCTTTPKRTPNT